MGKSTPSFWYKGLNVSIVVGLILSWPSAQATISCHVSGEPDQTIEKRLGQEDFTKMEPELDEATEWNNTWELTTGKAKTNKPKK